MAFLKLTIAYDGTKFSGWQVQPNVPTVQGALLSAWESITGQRGEMTSASRTDAGVHAAGQVVAIETETSLDAQELLSGLNAKLPESVVVLSVQPAPDGFHATHDAVGKRYRYQIHNDRVRPVFDRSYVWQVPRPLDDRAMHRAGQQLLGKHDFCSFQSAGSERESTVRTLSAVEVHRGQGAQASRVLIEVEGDGFLYNMVRIIVGTLIEVGRGKRPENWLGDVLQSLDRSAAGPTAPPQGLMLLHVDYE